MAKILYVGTNGSENPTKSIFPFQWANAAVEAGNVAAKSRTASPLP